MNNRVEATDLNEPAKVIYGRGPGEPRSAPRQEEAFDELVKALRHAVNEMPENRRDDAIVETRSGVRYDWSQIQVLYEHVRIAASR